VRGRGAASASTATANALATPTAASTSSPAAAPSSTSAVAVTTDAAPGFEDRRRLDDGPFDRQPAGPVASRSPAFLPASPSSASSSPAAARVLHVAAFVTIVPASRVAA